MANLQLWDKVLSNTIQLPLVNVDRDAFLTKEFSRLVSDEQMAEILSNGPIGVVSPATLHKISQGCIKYHLTAVTATSTLAGLPGGWGMLASVPADIAQFFGHVLSLMQKLLYLHGFPSIKNPQGEIDDETLCYMTMFVGVMFGSHTAQKLSNEVLSNFAKTASKKLARQALTKTAWYPIVKQVGKWIGVKVTKDSFAKSAGKVIPLIGAPISGSITYFTFRPMANRLHKHLKEKFIEQK